MGNGTSPYVELDRAAWRTLRDSTPPHLTADELDALRSLGDPISMDEVRDVYLPLSRLLNLHVAATQRLHQVVRTFLGRQDGEDARDAGSRASLATPFVIGIAGSVAVGKSTAARLLRTLLARWPDHPRVELVPTDGFLHPNAVLAERGLMARKGFPESYDRRALLRFVSEVKAGAPEVSAPVYSHLSYDIVPGQTRTVRRPDILVLEGLNVLQPPLPGRLAVSDFFDFSIYVDAHTDDIRQWYVERFLALRGTAFADPASYFHRYATLSDTGAVEEANRIWREINEVNLVENILPTRARASLVLRKAADHAVHGVRLRKT